MTRRLRLDAELVRRGLARSREQAAELIEGGCVSVAGIVARKPATNVSTDQAVVVRDGEAVTSYASRGAHKLLGALAVFEPAGLSVDGRRCLDAGASTGGFTDVLLRHGAAEVVAVDVGYGQLVWELQQDPRVHVFDRTNIRHLVAATIGGPVDLVVSDLSFISLRLVLVPLTSLCLPGGDLVLMVKPQFEVGKDRLGKKGVVREPEQHVESVLKVCRSAQELGWGTAGLAASPLPGPAGNVEYFCWLTTGAGEVDVAQVRDVVASGPLSERLKA